jgi:hypothetical protein
MGLPFFPLLSHEDKENGCDSSWVLGKLTTNDIRVKGTYMGRFNGVALVVLLPSLIILCGLAQPGP